MNLDNFAKKMKALELYRDLMIPADTYPILRIDGRSFKTFTKNLKHPFDRRLQQQMILASMELADQLGVIYAYTQSDEISLLLPKDTELFARRVEKLTSVSASIATSIFTLEYQFAVQALLIKPGEQSEKLPNFDSRVVVAPSIEVVVDYFRWRQADAMRNCLGGYEYWTLRKKGYTSRQATVTLKNLEHQSRNELLIKEGIDLAQVPSWQKNGVGIYYDIESITGEDPRTGEKSSVNRRYVQINDELPIKDDYSAFLLNIIKAYEDSKLEGS